MPVRADRDRLIAAGYYSRRRIERSRGLGAQVVQSRLKTTLFRLAPAAIMAGIFLLGFAGKPEDSPWLNSSQLWQKGDPFFWEGVRFLASPYFLYRGRPHVEGEWSYYGVRNQYRHNELGLRDDPLIDPKPTDFL